jgi:hypothetical protein
MRRHVRQQGRKKEVKKRVMRVDTTRSMRGRGMKEEV